MIERFRNSAFFAWAWLMSSPALAQFKMGDDTWIEPFEGIISDVTAGIVRAILGIAFLGICIVVGFGLFSGRIDWGRAAQIVAGAAVVALGGDALAQLLS